MSTEMLSERYVNIAIKGKVFEGMEFYVPSAWYKRLIEKQKLKIKTNVEQPIADRHHRARNAKKEAKKAHNAGKPIRGKAE